jgi:hypothetical protein
MPIIKTLGASRGFLLRTANQTFVMISAVPILRHKAQGPEVRHLFYCYYAHTHLIAVDERLLDKPWFFVADHDN